MNLWNHFYYEDCQVSKVAMKNDSKNCLFSIFNTYSFYDNYTFTLNRNSTNSANFQYI